MTKHFTTDQARTAGQQIGINWNNSPFPVTQLRDGMDIELEHGTRDPQTNITDDDTITTAKIALAHLKESPRYYQDLARMEAAEDKQK